MRSEKRKNTRKAALLLAALLVFAAGCLKQGEKVNVPLTASDTPEPPVVKASDSTFAKFSHSVAEHKQFDCVSCHRREGKSKTLEFAGHDSCVGCHLSQFTNPGEKPAMCSICHDKMDSTPPTMKAFPTKFIEGFNMKFDHAAHSQGRGRPAQGCALCHTPSGPGQSIQSGIDTHATCYACHTPESKIGSCTVCHALGPYNRTLQSQYGFKAIFRHGDHTARQGVSCSECHNVVAGAPLARQVTNISILQHRTSPGNNCLQCHNGRRAFTGNNPFDVGSCTRCHTGSGFAALPVGTAPDEKPPEEK
ncbi:MAG: cytochrome c3 family protein [Pyrinomonadaceae bacterium]